MIDDRRSVVTTSVAIIKAYLAGDLLLERPAVRALLGFGAAIARSRGLQSADVEAVSLDFAAYVVTSHRSRLPADEVEAVRYLARAARWFVDSHLRTERRHPSCAIDVELAERLFSRPEAALDLVVEQRLLVEDLECYIRSLSPIQQELYRICIVEARTSQEAAEVLGRHPAAVRQLLSRLRKRLRAWLRSTYFSIDDTRPARRDK